MFNWVMKPLGELITLQRGHDLPSQCRVKGNIPIMGSSGVTGYHNESKRSGPGVVIGRSGNSMGEVSFSPVDYWPLNTCLYVTDFKGNDERYIYYLLQTINFDQFNSGSAQKSLNRNAVYPYEVKTTECKEEQRRISKVLSDLENKIELNRQTNQTLEQIAQAIFKSWFVDFEPTRAKIAAKQNGQDPERAAMAAISGLWNPDAAGASLEKLEQLSDEQLEQLKETAALFPDALVESELGEIPEGWEVSPVTEFGSIVCGKTPSKKNTEFYGCEIPFIKIPDMHGGAYVTKYTEYLSKEGAISQAKKQVPAGSVCVSCIATVGKVLITHRESHTNQQINSIVPSEKYLTPYLYFQLLGQNKLLHDLASGGSATLNLNTGNFSKVEILKPYSALLERFSQLVSVFFEEILEKQFENDSIQEIRGTLLTKLLSGELKVKSIDDEVEYA